MFKIHLISTLKEDQISYPIPVLVNGTARGEGRKTFAFQLYSLEGYMISDDFPGWDVPSIQEFAICRDAIFKEFNVTEPQEFKAIRREIQPTGHRTFVIADELVEQREKKERRKRCIPLNIIQMDLDLQIHARDLYG